ncbi:hypothetical protein TNCV_1793211 [Trichonephila clavipes]|nr:hypothetical protein TNCV_1793211 [Trichonephila clavipes]
MNWMECLGLSASNLLSGEDGGRSGLTRTKLKYVTRAGMEERKEGGAPPKRVRGAPKTQSEWRMLRDFFFCSWDEKWMETARQNLQPNSC